MPGDFVFEAFIIVNIFFEILSYFTVPGHHSGHLFSTIKNRLILFILQVIFTAFELLTSFGKNTYAEDNNKPRITIRISNHFFIPTYFKIAAKYSIEDLSLIHISEPTRRTPI